MPTRTAYVLPRRFHLIEQIHRGGISASHSSQRDTGSEADGVPNGKREGKRSISGLQIREREWEICSRGVDFRMKRRETVKIREVLKFKPREKNNNNNNNNNTPPRRKQEDKSSNLNKTKERKREEKIPLTLRDPDRGHFDPHGDVLRRSSWRVARFLPRINGFPSNVQDGW